MGMESMNKKTSVNTEVNKSILAYVFLFKYLLLFKNF